MKKPKQIDESNKQEVEKEIDRVFALLEYFCAAPDFTVVNREAKKVWARNRLRRLMFISTELFLERDREERSMGFLNCMRILIQEEQRAS